MGGGGGGGRVGAVVNVGKLLYVVNDDDGQNKQECLFSASFGQANVIYWSKAGAYPS